MLSIRKSEVWKLLLSMRSTSSHYMFIREMNAIYTGF